MLNILVFLVITIISSGILEGIVEKGKQEARKLECPTANIRLPNSVSVKPGVWAGQAKITEDEKHRIYRVMCYISDERPEILEVHFFDFKANLYGKKIQIKLIQHIRAPMKFGSFEEAKRQIEKDKKSCKEL